MQVETFEKVIQNVWNCPQVDTSVMGNWQQKVRNLRIKLRGWSVNVEAANRKKKYDLIREYDTLDRLAENLQLDQDQIERMDLVLMELNKIWAMEETKARQDLRIGT